MSQSVNSTELRFSRRCFAACLATVGLAGIAGRSAVADETAEAVTEHPLTPAIRHAKTSVELVSKMPSYECTFTKKEVVGKQVIAQTMQMKVRHEPFSIYMHFDEPHAGREVIFVAGKNNNNLLVHEAGFASLVGTLELAPDSSQVMAPGRSTRTPLDRKSVSCSTASYGKVTDKPTTNRPAAPARPPQVSS